MGALSTRLRSSTHRKKPATSTSMLKPGKFIPQSSSDEKRAAIFRWPLDARSSLMFYILWLGTVSLVGLLYGCATAPKAPTPPPPFGALISQRIDHVIIIAIDGL